MLGERHECRRSAVVGEQRRVLDASREVDRAAEPQALDERDHPGVELRLVAEGTDEDELRFRIDAAPVVRKHPHQIVLPFVGRYAAHEEEHAAEALPAREHRLVRRHSEMLPVQKNGNAGRLLVPRLGERAAVEFGDADTELERRCDPRELSQPETSEGRGVRIDAAEELRWRDVVIHEHAARRDLDQLIDDLAAHREMDDEQIIRLHLPEEPAVRPHIGDAGLRLDRVRERVIAPVPDLLAQREDVVAHGVAGREGWMELMHPHFGACPITA